MAGLTLHIGNKRYSSWSLRPWIALTVKAIPFAEVLHRFDDHPGREDFHGFSPSGRVPVLVHDGLTVWESLAILEYVAELHPEAGLWPAERAARARARAMANEMHGGFGALRSQCPMNMARARRRLEPSPATRRDVTRIERLWDEALAASGGPFLFGGFGNVDAMFAPVVNRLDRYMLSEHPAVAAHTAAMTALPAWQAWEAAGRAEPWIVPEDEA